MASSQFSEVLRLAIEAAVDPSVRDALTTIQELGASGEVSDDQLTELLETLTRTAPAQGMADAFRKTGQHLRDLERDFRTGTERVKELDAAEKASADTLRSKREELDRAQKTQRSYQDGSHALLGTQEQINATQRAARETVRELAAEVRQAEAAHRADAQALEQQRAALSNNAQARDRTSATLRRLKGDLQAAGIDTSRLAAEEKRLAEEARAAGQAIQAAAEQARHAAAAKASLAEAAGKARVALAAAGAALYGVGRATGSAVQASSEFATAMGRINTQLSDTSKLDGISQSLRELAREFGSDVTANAEALYETMSAGGEDAAESLALLAEANKLAVAGGADLVDTSKLIRAAIAAYGDDIDQASRYSDSLFHALRIGNLELDELASNFARVAPFAATAGVSVDEISTALGTLTTGGVAANEATTSLVALLNNVIKPSQQAVKTAEELGIEFSVAGLRARGLAGFIEHVTTATQGNEEAIARLFGSTNALNGVLQLGGTLFEDYQVNLDDAANAAGRVDEAFGKMAETPAQAAARFRAAVNDLRISAGDAFTALTPLVEGLTGLVNAFNDLPGPIRTAAAAAGIFATAALPLAAAMRAINTLLPALIGTSVSGLLGMSAGASKSAVAVEALTRALSAAWVAMTRLTAVGGAIWLVHEWAEMAAIVRATAEATDDARVAATWLEYQVQRTKESYGHLAQAQILSADALAEMAEIDLARHVRELDGAAKYWRAVEVQARQAGEAAEAAFARERADQFAAAAGNARDRLEEVRAAASGIGDAAAQAFARVHTELTAASTTAQGLGKHLDEAFKDRDFRGTAQELGQMAVAMAQVGSYASQSDAIIREGLLESLSRLTGRDLLAFRDAAKAAFAEAGTAAEDAARVMDTVVTAAMRNLGLSAEAAGQVFSAEGSNIIALFEVVAQSGTATAQQIESSFRGALSRISTSAEAEALGEVLRRAMEQGAIGADAANRAMAALQRRIQELKEAASPLADAFAQLGIRSQAELNRAAEAARAAFDAIVEGARHGAAAQEDVARAFFAWAEAARAAAANSNEYTRRQVEALIRTRAAALGLRDALDEAGDSGLGMGNKVAAGAGVAAAALKAAADAVKDSTAATGEAAAATRDLSTAYGGLASSANLGAVAIRGLGGEFVPWTRTANGWAQVVYSVNQSHKEMAASAAAAREALSALNDELDRAALERDGNQEALAEIEHREAMARIDELAKAAGNAGIAEAAEARKRQEDLHKTRMEQIRAERAAAMESADAVASQKAQQAAAQPAQPSPQAAAETRQPVVINIDGREAFRSPNLNSEQELRRLVQEVVRQLSNHGGAF